MNIRELLRLARARWPEPDGKSHHITLNNPAHGVGDREEDWLTLGVWVGDRVWYFYIAEENIAPRTYLDAVEALIHGVVQRGKGGTP